MASENNPPNAERAAITPVATEALFSLEELRMPVPRERLGLFGLQFQRDWRGGFRAGLGGYGALRGEKGGFITMGLSGAYRLPLGGRFSMEAGLFAGAGGAGRAYVGGGLMLRGNLGISLRAGRSQYGLDWSRVRFPNGSIDSSQVSFRVSVPFRVLVFPEGGSLPFLNLDEMGLRNLAVSAAFERYSPFGSVRTLGGALDRKPVDLVGIEAQLNLSTSLFGLMGLMAAHGGSADGYMESLFGLGYRQRLSGDGAWTLTGRLSAGPAGGGRLDVGGGLAYKASLDLEYRWNKGGFISTGIGHIQTPTATFKAWTWSLRAGKSFRVIQPSGPERVLDKDSLRPGTWAIRSSYQRLESPQRSQGTASLPIELLGLKLDRLLDENWYLTGQGCFAATGKAGGYAVGLLGLGWRSPSFFGGTSRILLEANAGAGGGGGVDTRGGFLLQPMLGWEQKLGHGLYAQAMAGRSRAPRGRLDTNLFDLGLIWRFGTLEAL